ncbi:MAG: hypothetical protein UT20_C0014G0001, partial [Candidatus Levybacteria bacterium GW2011_GWA1_39_11]
SFTNLNNKKSAETAPVPPITPSRIGFNFSANTRRLIIPVATPKVETKSIPAKKDPTYPKAPKFNRN